MSAPSAPTNVVLQTGNGQNLLSWSIVVGATSYSVQRSTDGVTFSALGISSVPYYLDSTASIGTAYYYQVAAVNGASPSAYTPSYPTSITPCLPGQINLGYLRYQAQLRADKLNSNYLTLDEWNANINQISYELYDLLVSKFGDDYFLAPALQFNLSGLDSYLLPNGDPAYTPEWLLQTFSGIPALY